MKISEIEKQHHVFTQHSTKCKCGHTMLIASKDGKRICTNCHKYVFATPEIEKKYRKNEFKKTLRRELDEQRRIDD